MFTEGVRVSHFNIIHLLDVTPLWLHYIQSVNLSVTVIAFCNLAF